MLSYQHSYHAGNRADVHKHEILCRALGFIKKVNPKKSVLYAETHAGRGLYDLTGTESIKTREAQGGWLRVAGKSGAIKSFSDSYIQCIRALNKGKLMPSYPGSPMIAAHILGPNDKIRLFELHPAEFAALRQNMGKDKRAHIQKADGIEGALQLIIPPDLLMIDPSYEIKSEYETVPEAALKLHKKWSKARIMIWVPMLGAGRHKIFLDKINALFPKATISKIEWIMPEESRGMHGSIMVGINTPEIFKTPLPSAISDS
jgi:23S rRNA (adenine2030-N6)-methyltransferase